MTVCNKKFSSMLLFFFQKLKTWISRPPNWLMCVHYKQMCNTVRTDLWNYGHASEHKTGRKLFQEVAIKLNLHENARVTRSASRQLFLTCRFTGSCAVVRVPVCAVPELIACRRMTMLGIITRITVLAHGPVKEPFLIHICRTSISSSYSEGTEFEA
jgi:hypothetical protein